MRYFEKTAIVSYGIDFLAGADPTGYASQVRGKKVTNNVGLHRVATDLGGFTLGAGIGTALTAGSLAIASKITKGPIKHTLKGASEDTINMILKPKQTIKNIQTFIKARPVLNRLQENANKIPDISGTEPSSQLKQKLHKLYDSYQEVRDAKNELAVIGKQFGGDPLTMSSSGAMAIAGLATAGLAGSLNALTSDIQFKAGRELQRLSKKRDRK